MLFKDFKTVLEFTAPAPGRAVLPENFPFPLEDASFSGAGGIRLAGWYLPPRNGVVIILLHGYGSNRTMMLPQAEWLAEAGYGVLLYDERATGESGGTMRAYGWPDDEDVRGALDYIAGRGESGALDYIAGRGESGATDIGMLGCSIGGQIALRAAIRYPQIAAVVADGPAITRTSDMVLEPSWAAPIFYTSSHFIDIMLSAYTGITIPPGLTETIGEIYPRPILLIGGGVSQPYAGSEEPKIRRYAENAGSNAEVWVIPNGTHCNGPAVAPEEYRRRMIEFFDRSFEIANLHGQRPNQGGGGN